MCAYDRAGFGLSERVSTPEDASHVVDELHGLLDAASVARPIVLMGHSVAGLYVREYTARYPQDIAGLVIVDGSSPLQEDDPALRAVDDYGWKLRLDKLWSRIPAELGVPRLKGMCVRNIPGFDARAAALAGEDLCGLDWRAIDNEQDNFELSGRETQSTGPFGALPILIVSQDPAMAGPNQVNMNVAKAWNQMQENLKKLSTRSRRIIARRSGHMVQLRRPELLNSEVALFIGQIRGTAPQPAAYKTTITE